MPTKRTNFFLQKPGKGRASWLILKLEVTDGAKKTKKVNSEALEAINKAFLAGEKSFDACELLVREVIKQLYTQLERQKPKLVHNQANLQLLERYWQAEYVHRDLVDPISAKNAYTRAVEAVGELSLYTASREELQARIAKASNQRKVASDLNILLKFIGRDVKLRRNKKQRVEISYLSEADFQLVLKKITDSNFANLAASAFYTGCRAGELFAAKAASIIGKFLLVSKQVDRVLRRRDTKTRSERKAFIVPAGLDALNAWINFENKNEYRNKRLAEQFRNACRATFPRQPEKWITFHDLRHSYAVHLLSKGISLDHVAQSLGDSVPVCQEYYAGFILVDESIELMATKFSK